MHINVAPLLRRFCLLVAAALPLQATAVRIVTTPDVLDDYQRLYANADPLMLDYAAPGQRRDVVELLLVQQALRHGGIDSPAQFVSAPTYRRLIALVADGHADITGNTVWDFDIAREGTRLRASSQLIPPGDFVASFFHAPGQTRIGDHIRRRNWSALRAVSSHNWEPDWQALSALGLAELADVPDWPAMVKMVAAGRADFLLAPGLSAPRKALELGNVQLVPVADVCIVLGGARALAISRKADKALLAAVERGLATLRREGKIRQAYAEAGFLTEQQRRCQRLNP